MTHYSMLSKVVVDVPTETHDAEVAFWGDALGVELTRSERFPEYHLADLPGAGVGVGFLVQHLGSGSARIHLDIHASNRVAEVNRLTALGASVVDDGEHWTIMRDPAGLLFCVIPDPRIDATNGYEWSADD